MPLTGSNQHLTSRSFAQTAPQQYTLPTPLSLYLFLGPTSHLVRPSKPKSALEPMGDAVSLHRGQTGSPSRQVYCLTMTGPELLRLSPTERQRQASRSDPSTFEKNFR